MDPYGQLREVVWQYAQGVLLPHYSFELWKDTLTCRRMREHDRIRALWHFIQPPLYLQDVNPDCRQSLDPWAPCLTLTLGWTVANRVLQIEITLDRGQVLSTAVMPTIQRTALFGEPPDLLSAFQKQVMDCAFPGR